MSVARVALLGAESTGKSTLAQALAARYGTRWVPEYLREFVDVHARVPREDALARDTRARHYLFCDTTPLMTAVYSRVYWGRVPHELLALEAAHDYAFTLVAAPDLPWVPDGLQRESEAVRLRVHAQLVEVLEARGIAFTLLTGELAARVAQVEALLGRPAAEKR